ncbi:MAG: hypothetical protein ACOC3Z_03525 [Nanoarchaeota archaeon]
MNFKKFFNSEKDDETFNVLVQGFGDNIKIDDEKKVLSPDYDIERFYNTISKLDKKNQLSRKNHISNLFFRDFIGLDLLGGKIKNIKTDVVYNTDYDYYGISIIIDNGGVVNYNYHKSGNNIEEYLSVKRTIGNKSRNEITESDKMGVSRKEARIITKIIKKFNQKTEKYKVGTDDLLIKEYESKIYSFNDFLNEKKQ